MRHKHSVGLLKELKPGATAEQREGTVADGIRRKRGTPDIPERLPAAGYTAKTAGSTRNRIGRARFSQRRCLADFDFEQSLVHRPALELLLGGGYQTEAQCGVGGRAGYGQNAYCHSVGYRSGGTRI